MGKETEKREEKGTFNEMTRRITVINETLTFKIAFVSLCSFLASFKRLLIKRINLQNRRNPRSLISLLPLYTSFRRQRETTKRSNK